MLGAVYDGKTVSIKEVEIPRISLPSEVIVRVRACGLCGTDLGIMEGRVPARAPVILGHECAGEVSEVGSGVRSVAAGDHVVIDPNLRCGTCSSCRSEKPNLCENLVSIGEDIDGGFATFLAAPEKAVYKIPASMEWKTAALTEPFSCVVNGFKRARVKPSETAVVYGAGPMGLFWISLFRLAGLKRIIAVEIAPKRLEAAVKVGADVGIDPSSEDPVKRVKEETGGSGVDISVEVIGKVETVESAIKSLGRGGRAILMGTVKGGAEARFSPSLVMRYEREILGTFTQNATFNPAIDLLSSGRVPVEKIVTDEVPLNEIERAFSKSKSGEAIKAVVIL
jgi:(R,R)-butanediol dehydrogenase / meso-butanediol dehydrogenase / diacetyl reductase